ncbi:DNA topoisomerase 2 isoform X2 [Dendroctonus ponderosae]|nr:DNA topoisomerase 2 isoform X2 [Dendroctonus ponderosae]
MLTNMSNGNTNGAGDNKVAPPKKKPATIEQTYQKKSQLEHILLRPDTYIGSVETATEPMWIYDTDREMMVQKIIDFVPGLYKIFDEILVNAADNKQRDQSMDCIKIEIKPEENMVSVWNNGKGIPVVMHEDEKMYVPTMIFGHLLTSSNYNDEEEKVTGGRNGYGAKLCNIYSEKFIVETASKEHKRHFKQTWGSNMTKASEPKIKDFFGADFTKITFYPDLAKFHMDKLTDDIVGLMSRRAFDVAASTKGVKVFLNGQRLPIKNFRDYVQLYFKGEYDERGNPLKVVYEEFDERWEVAVTLSDSGFQQMSFVNSIATTKGGRHVEYIVEMIAKQLLDIIKKKNKGGTTIKPHQVKNHMWVFINCLIVNPTFDSQTKENMTLQVKKFGSKCSISDKFILGVQKSGIIETVLTWAKLKEQTELVKASTGKSAGKLKIHKLVEANKAGSATGWKCTLILTEGDSAKTLAVSGLSVIGRDYYGVFPLRGKLLNVREATHKQILENVEINSLLSIIGLQYKKKYLTRDDLKSLRYGKIMIMTDQDQDGSHIKGLLINFIHYNWPELLRLDFLEEFITPIVKAKKKNQEISFYSLPEFEEWKKDTANHHTFEIKYYKGLGTSTSKEAKEYFGNMTRHKIPFRYGGPEDDDHIVLAFSKKHIEARKEWLTNFMVDSKHRKEMGLPEKYLYAKDTRFVNYKDFVNLELVLFSNADNIRSIPSLVDGLKPGQRKVLYTCLKRNDKREVKVAQLAGSVAETSAYHHGEVSLAMTIVNLAQNYVGSNNINLLEPRGQFGTRLAGGKDSASPRYIFTKLSPLTRLLFHPDDDPLLKHEYDDSQKIEPVWYIPIIPMVLVNGADGIGTGWMTKIPNYNPRDLVECIRSMLDGEEPKELHPWYKNFKGTVEFCGDKRYCISGELAIMGNTLEITELPVGTWTQTYKENVLEAMQGSDKVKNDKAKEKDKDKDKAKDKVKDKCKWSIQDFKEYSTDTTVHFVVTPSPSQMELMEKEGLHTVFKLQSLISLGSMCCFDELGCLRRFDTVMDILKEFYTLRMSMYVKRKDHLEGMLTVEAQKLSNQARFIMEKCNGSLTVENKKRKVIVDELIRLGYDPDPVQEWKKMHLKDAEEEAAPEGEEELPDTTSKAKKPVDPEKAFKNLAEVKKFDYLLGMSMWMLTEEKKNELLKQRDNKLTELDILKKKKPSDLWREDLDIFAKKLDEVEEKERKDELNTVKKEKAEPGKKKAALKVPMSPPIGQRVVPLISTDIKKKVQAAAKSKEGRGKRMIKKEVTEEEDDEFDAMIKNKKTLKDKLGTPDEVEKKVKKKRLASDGLKQTKLNFEKKAVNGSPKKGGRKKRFNPDLSSDGQSYESDDSFSISIETAPLKERTNARRCATKAIKYDTDDEVNEMSDNDVLLDNNLVNGDEIQPQLLESDESDVEKPPPRMQESSEDLFDSLISGSRKEDSKEENVSSSSAPKRRWSTESEEDHSPPQVVKSKADDQPKKPRAKKIKKETNGKEQGAAKKARGRKMQSSSDEDFEIDESSEPVQPVKSRTGRNRPQKKYVEDSDDDF